MTRARAPRRFQGWWPPVAALAVVVALHPSPAWGQSAPADTVLLAWTAPGDDGRVGTATAYELRWSALPIHDGNWTSATAVGGAPVPLPAGSPQRMVVRGLSYGTTYYFALRSRDDLGNWSEISNVLRWDWVYDTAAPAAPMGLSAAPLGGGDVRVRWTPNAEADLSGYSVYRSLDAAGPFVALNGALVPTTDYLDDTLPTGTEVVWYQVTALDESGNESARSATLRLSLVAEAVGWTLQAGYPNPSAAGTIVRIPLAVPAAGGSARLEIVDRAGQRVWVRELGSLPAGTTVLQWDGHNDAGREVAPGVYVAWLVAGSTRTSVRLVRVP